MDKKAAVGEKMGGRQSGPDRVKRLWAWTWIWIWSMGMDQNIHRQGWRDGRSGEIQIDVEDRYPGARARRATTRQWPWFCYGNSAAHLHRAL